MKYQVYDGLVTIFSDLYFPIMHLQYQPGNKTTLRYARSVVFYDFEKGLFCCLCLFYFPLFIFPLSNPIYISL